MTAADSPAKRFSLAGRRPPDHAAGSRPGEGRGPPRPGRVGFEGESAAVQQPAGQPENGPDFPRLLAAVLAVLDALDEDRHRAEFVPAQRRHPNVNPAEAEAVPPAGDPENG